jgi:YfiH family protein
MDDRSWLPAQWPAPGHIHAGCTTRLGGVSQPPYDSLNLAMHVEDDPESVLVNRRRLSTYLGLPAEPHWLQQVHGCGVSTDDRPLETADACVTQIRGRVCAVMTADCLPLLIADRTGTCVAAVHAGWRGLASQAISQTIDKMPVAASELLAWLGPAIGPKAFEVGGEVRDEFLRQNARFADCFVTGRQPGKWLLDIYRLARLQLAACAVDNVYGGSFCTYQDTQRFYSYRRDKMTGRMASLIWMAA